MTPSHVSSHIAATRIQFPDVQSRGSLKDQEYNRNHNPWSEKLFACISSTVTLPG
ncbi:hypothetical protein Fuma_05819 [Fuerstiella marisgermanici]|uniref:Uncharacterized protein n=1 Tax=Fuerstiella marisgermanici TaxID=1891926 RepID=A0A1P8WQ12_9PLAN|nr:hypothetical protein Fuma_05819 [Fuerstiella marisgermanici]